MESAAVPSTEAPAPGARRAQQRREGPEEERDRLRLQRRHRRRIDGARATASRRPSASSPPRSASSRRRSCSISFVPMFLVAGAYYYMNKADPDCGTSFSWVTLGMGPHLGWMVGWVIVVTDIVVMANLAQIAGLYTFLLVGWDSAAASTFAVTAGRRRLDPPDDRDRRDRDRALGPDPDRASGGGDLHPGAVRRRRDHQGLRRRGPATARSTPASPGSTRSASAPARSPPGCCSRCSSTGAGTRRRPSTRRPRTRPRRRARRP